ncbi:hypothetical protein DID75_02050 [Candidatus Marinamargulisbacteria bacterium SCGC AG-410-N11]|nr:hypothetical protein DID75_02050 [Candidatus Marinamargulisbacteria bacterium SCGC AG-410-N11]
MILTLTFLSIVLCLLVITFYILRQSTTRYKLIFSAIIGWLFLTAGLAKSGFLMTFNTLPPRMVIVLIPVVVFLITLTRSKNVKSIIQATPQSILIYAQTCRFGIELLFYVLAAQQIIPDIMTWHGRNWDILIGLSAPLIGYLYCQKHVISKVVLNIWNYLGIALLLNVMTHGLLSAPTPFQVFHVEPANTFVATWPYVWIPAFVIPCAFAFHIFSIRKQ